MNHKKKEDDLSFRRPSVARSLYTRHDGGGMTMTTATDELGGCDVLLGRGTGPNEHIGNVRYRALVRKATEEGGIDYKCLSSAKKRDLAKEVVAAVKSMGGRFMKHATQNKSDDGGAIVRYYVEVPDNIAVDKVKQGFRHQIKAFPCEKKEINTKTASRGMKQIEKTKQCQQATIMVGVSNTTRTPSSPISMDTSKKRLQDQRPFLQGEKWDSFPFLSKFDTAISQSDSRFQGMAESSMLVARPLTTMTVAERGEHLSTGGMPFDQLYHGRPGSMLMYPDRRWLAPLSTMVTATMPAPFFRTIPQCLAPQHPRFVPFSAFPGGIFSAEWDPCVMDLLALRHERPNTGLGLHDLPVIRNKKEGGVPDKFFNR